MRIIRLTSTGDDRDETVSPSGNRTRILWRYPGVLHLGYRTVEIDPCSAS
jgi:hypothetical protein